MIMKIVVQIAAKKKNNIVMEKLSDGRLRFVKQIDKKRKYPIVILHSNLFRINKYLDSSF